jgi:NADPH:quinone reductase-like Zn-dependent oxidoreductase
MRVWQISSFGVDSLEFVERPIPEPGPGEVLVKVRAISFNYRDLMMVKGLYNPKLKLPRIPCSDGAGEVIAVGEDVTAWKPGDRVAGIFMQNWLDGALTAETSTECWPNTSFSRKPASSVCPNTSALKKPPRFPAPPSRHGTRWPPAI